MFSIPGQDNPTWEAGLERTIALAPDHVSAYNLTYEEDTEFLTKLRQGTPGFRHDEDTDASQFRITRETLSAAGLAPYEISNYATPGHRSRHNAAYWAGNDYLGLGPSAVSTLNGTRSQNPSNTEAYTAAPNPLDRTHEHLTPEDFRIERIALGLRLAEGIPLTLISEPALARAKFLAEESLLRLSQDNLTLTEKGMPLTDEIAAELIV
jgi:oxygen-independent coproporphyrinogen III oxidase